MISTRQDQRCLWTGFVDSAIRFPNRQAVYVEKQYLSYSELFQASKRIAATIQQHDDEKLAAVFGYRSAVAFGGVLGVLLSGRGYVPLNRTFPVERTKIMLERSKCKTIVVDQGSATQLDEIVQDARYPLTLLFPDVVDVSEYQTMWPQHRILGANDLEGAERWQVPPGQTDEVAYLLFTSGSTGIPKGVQVAHRNVIPFVDCMVERYGITEQDRLSQMFDMTFDLSVFDMFVTWEKGACLYCPSQKTLMKPGKFVRDMELTLWFSVPSTAVFMKRFGMLKPGSYPTLKWSLFCGEPLPVASVRQWIEAAPNSTLENLYGPTELTIACTLYRWNRDTSEAESEMGIVPIGYPYPAMELMIVDGDLREVPEGEEGELLMTGPQLTLGYWRDAEKTEMAFVIPPGRSDTFYRTGDRVRKPRDGKPIIYLGRVDFQIKIHGHRVELGEIEAVVREETGLDGAVALGWPETPSGAGGVEVFIEGKGQNTEQLRQSVSKRLPDYMLPSRFHYRDKLPLNVNGKYDRKQLANMLREMS